MAIFRLIINSAVVEYDLDRNPITSVEDIDTSTHRVYTEEEPNSLDQDAQRNWPMDSSTRQ